MNRSLPTFNLLNEAEMRAFYESCGFTKKTTEAAIALLRQNPFGEKNLIAGPKAKASGRNDLTSVASKIASDLSSNPLGRQVPIVLGRYAFGRLRNQTAERIDASLRAPNCSSGQHVAHSTDSSLNGTRRSKSVFSDELVARTNAATQQHLQMATIKSY
jgi:hypothetical protein